MSAKNVQLMVNAGERNMEMLRTNNLFYRVNDFLSCWQLERAIAHRHLTLPQPPTLWSVG